MTNKEEIAEIVKKELTTTLEETFGPLLLEIAKNLKTKTGTSNEEDSPLMTEVIALKLQTQMLRNQMNDISQNMGLPLPEQVTNQSFVPEASPKAQIDDQVIRKVVQEEINQINTTVLNEFQNIDKILARFFKKSVADNKQIMTILEGASSGQPPTQTKQERRPVKATQVVRETTIPASTPAKTTTPVSEPSSSYATSRSTQASFTTSGKEFDSDIDRIGTVIEYFNQGNINPKDAIYTIEQLRDAIITERSEEAPYRVTASKMTREIIFALTREKSRRVLTDGTSTHVIKQLEVFLDHVRGVK
ncbi:MAG: hypothetical protein ACXACX_06110 [Candidatus Hodarchaeales archaeon]|jgi:hypothetical protein